MKDRIRLEVSRAEVLTLFGLVLNAVQAKPQPQKITGPTLRLLAYLYRKAKGGIIDKAKGKIIEPTADLTTGP